MFKAHTCTCIYLPSAWGCRVKDPCLHLTRKGRIHRQNDEFRYFRTKWLHPFIQDLTCCINLLLAWFKQKMLLILLYQILIYRQYSQSTYTMTMHIHHIQEVLPKLQLFLLSLRERIPGWKYSLKIILEIEGFESSWIEIFSIKGDDAHPHDVYIRTPSRV